MKLRLFLTALLLTSLCQAATQDFSIFFDGDLSSYFQKTNNTAVPSYSYVRFNQTYKNKNLSCDINLTGRFFKIVSATSEQNISEASLGNAYCSATIADNKFSLGLLSPEWSEGVGVVSADQFTAYDLRQSPFVGVREKKYNPMLLVEKYFSDSTLSAYVASSTSFHEYNLQALAASGFSIQNDSAYKPIEYGLRYSLTANESDIQFNFHHIRDRRTQFAIKTLPTTLESYNETYNAVSAGYSTEVLGGMFRLDYSRYLSRTYSDKNLVKNQGDWNYIGVGYDSPTILNTIFALQYSSESLFSNKPSSISEAVGEWLAFSSRTSLDGGRTLEITALHNNKDHSNAYKIDFMYPNKRFTEMHIGAEYFPKYPDSSFFASYTDASRIYLRYVANLTQ